MMAEVHQPSNELSSSNEEVEEDRAGDLLDNNLLGFFSCLKYANKDVNFVSGL